MYEHNTSAEEPTRYYGKQILQYVLSSTTVDDGMKSKIMGGTAGLALVDAAEQYIRHFKKRETISRST